MKKLFVTAAVLSVIGFAGIQAASAHGNFYNRGDNGYCGSFNSDATTYNKENVEAIEKFRADTSAIRKEIVVKRSELNALYRNDNPDETKVAKLTGELYDLETELSAKAENIDGLNNRAYGHGPGMMNGYGPGMMRGYGWGSGGHMMGW